MFCFLNFFRYVSAKQNVNCGDIVAIETPYSCVLLPSYNKTHCSECCKRVSTLPYPCQQCRNVVYCSHTCQEKSWESYHKYIFIVLFVFIRRYCRFAVISHLHFKFSDLIITVLIVFLRSSIMLQFC